MEKMQNKTTELENVEKGIKEALIGLTRKKPSSLFPVDTIPIKTSNNSEHTQNPEEENKKESIDSSQGTRQSSTNISTPAQSAHGTIIVRKSKDDAPIWGSGTLIGLDLVLTAAHLVYGNEKPIRKSYPLIKFIPGIDGDGAPFGEIEVDHVIATEDFIHHSAYADVDGMKSQDFAILILSKRIGFQTGYSRWFSIPFGLRDKFMQKEISVVGYYEEKIKGKQTLWAEKRKIADFHKNHELMYYDIDASSEIQAGGGVFYEDEAEKNKYYLIGVHLGKNVAIRITDKFFGLFGLIATTRNRMQKFQEVIQGRDEEDCIKVLDYSRKPIGPSGLSFLLQCGLNGLKKLNLSNCNLNEKAIGELSSRASWKNLKILALNSNGITEAGISQLIQNSGWLELEKLYLVGNEVGGRGAALLASCKHWKKLKVIDLSRNRIDGRGALEIGKNEAWKNLEKVKLSKNLICDKGVHILAKNNFWSRLEQLDLSANKIGNTGAIAIASNMTWTELKILDLSYNMVGDEGAVAIGRNILWKRLQRLNLSENAIGWKGAFALIRNSAWTKIDVIDVSSNRKLTEERIKALETSPRGNPAFVKLPNNFFENVLFEL